MDKFVLVMLFMLLPYKAMAGPPNQEVLFNELLADITLPEPSRRSPLVLKSAILEQDLVRGSTFNLYLKVHLSPGWHIYEYDPAGTFTVTEHALVLPEGITATGEWVRPDSVPYPADPEIFIYHGDMVFVRELKVESSIESGQHPIAVKFRYQTCDPSKCLAPRVDVETLFIDIE